MWTPYIRPLANDYFLFWSDALNEVRPAIFLKNSVEAYSTVFWYVSPCNVAGKCRRFGENGFFLLQIEARDISLLNHYASKT